MTFEALLRADCGLLDTRGDLSVPVDSLENNSRHATKNGLFFCVPGLRYDAHDFAEQAVRNGCVALVVDHFLPLNVAQARVANVRAAMARIAGAFYGDPARAMKMIGITGTKGKTTTSYLAKAILEKAGYKVGLIGTTGNMIGAEHMDSALTTPDPIELHHTLAMMRDAGVTAVCMEVSAHAVDMHRLDGIPFEVACYTNLSQDHLDYFGDMTRYFETKKRFLVSPDVRNVALNADEETTAAVVAELTAPRLTYGICDDVDLYARNIEITETGVQFDMRFRGMDTVSVHLRMTGMFNVYNALAAAASCMILGVPLTVIREGLESVASVPGRIEMLPTDTPFKVILDYSHSPDALENILSTVRTFARKRVIVLFGCGGDRDHGKRPIMGEIAGRLADYSILTSDNPRTENPMTILAAVEEGIRPTNARYVVIENRREAIRYALTMAREGDVVILAGKGHETYQEIMGVKHPFDEKVVVEELLTEIAAGR